MTKRKTPPATAPTRTKTKAKAVATVKKTKTKRPKRKYNPAKNWVRNRKKVGESRVRL